MNTESYVNRYGSNALIIGASVTIGEQFCRQLAAKGMNVYMVARNEGSLTKIAEEIRETYRVEAHVIALDLLSHGAIDQLFELTSDVDISYLVVNANLHKINDFNLLSTQTKLDMVQMNITMPTLLCDHYGKKMTEAGKGGIIMTSAMNYLMGLEKDAVFQGTKAYVALFAESLWLEYRKQGVDVSVALINGIEGSPSYRAKTSSASRMVLKGMGISMVPEKIVEKCLIGFEKQRPFILPDYKLPFGRTMYTFMALSKILRFKWYARMFSAITVRLLNGSDLTK